MYSILLGKKFTFVSSINEQKEKIIIHGMHKYLLNETGDLGTRDNEMSYPLCIIHACT